LVAFASSTTFLETQRKAAHVIAHGMETPEAIGKALVDFEHQQPV
jgi:hypothetical protein